MRSVANRSWSTVLVEALKCELLCSNCHAETHRPDLAVEALLTLVGNCPPASTTRAAPAVSDRAEGAKTG